MAENTIAIEEHGSAHAPPTPDELPLNVRHISSIGMFSAIR